MGGTRRTGGTGREVGRHGTGWAREYRLDVRNARDVREAREAWDVWGARWAWDVREARDVR